MGSHHCCVILLKRACAVRKFANYNVEGEAVVLLFKTPRDAFLALPFLGENVVTCAESFRKYHYSVCTVFALYRLCTLASLFCVLCNT